MNATLYSRVTLFTFAFEISGILYLVAFTVPAAILSWNHGRACTDFTLQTRGTGLTVTYSSPLWVFLNRPATCAKYRERTSAMKSESQMRSGVQVIA